MGGDPDIFQPVLVGRNDYIGGDGVAGLELIERGWGLDGVGHDHWVHKAGDGFVVDVGLFGLLVDRDDFALKE